MSRTRLTTLIIGLLLVVGLAGGVVWRIIGATQGGSPGRGGAGPRVAPVEVAAVTVGPIRDRRTFSGTLEPLAEFVVAPKVAGRVERLTVQLGDEVARGQVVAHLDSDEFEQAVAQAEAELAVAEANLAEARSAAEIAEREFHRVQTLRQRGVASESQFDVADADRQAKAAAVQVAQAQVRRAQAALATARIRLGYTDVTASWANGNATPAPGSSGGGGDTSSGGTSGGRGEGGRRFVSRRFVDAGYTVAANAPLVSVAALDPLVAVIFVTEKDYARMQVGQSAVLTTDAWPGRSFEARVARLAPVFDQLSRQARVELAAPNPELKLKPGMFVRVTIVLRESPRATLVPLDALVRRDNEQGVFLVSDDGTTARWTPVRVGIREGDVVEVLGENIAGRVVTLGQQLVEDGSTLRITATRSPPSRPDASSPQPSVPEEEREQAAAAAPPGTTAAGGGR